MPVTALNTVVLPAPFGPMTETISLAGICRSSALTAVKPPKRIVSLVISRRFMAQFGSDLFRRQQTFRSEAHHQDQRETEEQVLPVARGGEDVVAADKLVGFEEIGDVFQYDGVKAGHDQGAEQHAPDVAHAADDDDAQRDDRDLKIVVAGFAAGAEIARPQRAGQTALRGAESERE